MGWRVWLVAFSVACISHALVLSVPNWLQSDTKGARAEGVGGIDIGLGQTGSYVEQLQKKVNRQAPVEHVPDRHVQSKENAKKVEPVVKKTAAKKPQPIEKRPSVASTKPPVKSKLKPTATTKTDKVYAVATAEPEAAPILKDVADDPERAATNRQQKTQQHEGRKEPLATGESQQRYTGGKVGSTSDYYALLMAQLNRYKRYPAQAKKAKQQGIVKVLFTVNRRGEVIKRSIKKSSGRAILDQAALDMFDAASPLPPLPEFIKREQLSMVLPVDFSLITNSAFKE